MKKRWMQVFLAFSTLILVACNQENTAEMPSKSTEPDTEQSTSNDEASKKDQEKTDSSESEDEEKNTEVDDDQVIDRIMKHIQETMDVEQDHVMILQSEQENYKIYEARLQNPEDPSVTNLIGMYRYYPEEDKLEIYNLTNDTYDIVE